MLPKKRKSRPSDDPYSLRQVEQPRRSDAATATLRHYSVDYVVQTPTANQVVQTGVGCASEPSREFGNQNRDCEIDTSELPSVMGPFFERGDVCAWYRGTSAVLPVVTPGKLYSGAFVPDNNLRRTERDGCVSHTDSIPTVLGENTRSPVTRCNDDVYTEQELQEMDANLAFIVPSESRMEILKEQAIELMLAASEPALPCGICELSFCQSKITATCLTDEFISLMRQSLTLHPDTTIPQKLKKQYDASGLDSRLKDLLLYPPAINTSGPYKTMNVCDSCRDHVESGTYTVPPACAIANGNYVGFLPRKFATMTRTDEQAIALVMPCASLSVVTGGSCKTIKSHHYVVRNTEGSIAEMLPRDLSSRVRVAMVGSMTSAQAAACKKRYHLNLPLCNQVLRFLKKHNREYQNGSEELIRPNLNSQQTIRTSVIIDRTSSTGTSTEDDEIVARVRDNSTYSAFGSVVEEGTERAIEESWIGASSVLSQPPPRDGFDVLVRKSNSYVPMSKWAVCVQMFPTLFPFGYGGPTEPRQTRLSVRKWILRCLQVHGHRFETHYAFLLLAFDFLATQNARDTMCVKMNIKRQALKAASIRRSTVMEAIKYFNHMNACRQKGIKPRPPSLDVQRVIDLRKGLYVPESAFYGSNTGRMRARHDLLGMLKRFGPLQVFFTVSPDSAGTYNIAIKTGRVSESAIADANLLLMPNRAERKSIAATHPVECARYFLRVMKTIIEVLLGWDTKARAPKRGGGIFGVVRAFGAAAETQLAGDLHAHIAVWLYGFPSSTLEYNMNLQTSTVFRDRVIQLADSVLCTKPPCIYKEQQCPACSAVDVLDSIIPGLDAFRRPRPGTAPPTTSRCRVCHTSFGDKDIINASVQNLAASQNTLVESDVVDFEKCRPPSRGLRGDLATSLLVRDVQVHYWNHCKSFFKPTVRTPKARVCRFFKPEEVHVGPTTIESGNKLRLHRAVGCEYVNAFNPVVMAALKCNHDAQFVINGSRDTAFYVVKYCFKNQNRVENPTALSLAAFAKGYNKADTLPDHSTDMQRGYRILGSMLYSITNGQEVAATMAALYILNETPFWFSHEFVHVNLRIMLAKNRESVEVSVSQRDTQDVHSTESNITAENSLERYWNRPVGLENVSFIEICEHYSYSGKKSNRSGDHSSQSSSGSFSLLGSPKIFVLCGDELPDITSDLNKEKHDYYYTALLTLFKPHRQSTLLASNQTLLGSYRMFLESGDEEHVQMLRKYEMLWQDYYHSQRSMDDTEESLEDYLVRTRAPATTSSIATPNDVMDDQNNCEGLLNDPIPDDFLDITDVVSPDTSTKKLFESSADTVTAMGAMSKAVLGASKQYNALSSISVPAGFTLNSYSDRLVKVCDTEAHVGTQEFIETFPTRRTRLEHLEECYAPIPYIPAGLEPEWTPDTLPPFPSISMVSQAFKLNFWQHVIFEVTVRHLIYAYSKDIDDVAGDLPSMGESRRDLYGIKSQLIAYLGGEAGTGKSTVVEALLAVAKCWGRDGSVETLAFTGAAAINIHGKTLHSARNLKLNGAEPNSAPSVGMKARFGRVVLVIIDEISITHQALLGGTDSVSRSMSDSPHKFMGGKHVLLIGDFLQLPPIGGHSCFQTPLCTDSRLRHAGYALYSAINFVVFLTVNMRARLDPVYADILDNLRWGRLSNEQLDLLNSRVQKAREFELPTPVNSDSFYRPIVVCTNKLRCAINHFMILKIAEMHHVAVYECLARPSSRSRTIVENLANATDDMTNRVPMKLLFYVGMPVMVTWKHPTLLDADIIANGVIGTVVGAVPPLDQLESTLYSVDSAIVHRLLQQPELLLIKLLGCRDTLVTDFPDGVIGIPPLHAKLKLKNIPNLSQTSITVDQFAVVPAFVCTTEKLQGQTCHDGVIVTPLVRPRGPPKQTLYVALSRATCLAGLTLTETITRAYLKNFVPSEDTVDEILRLIDLVRFPPYASEADIAEFRVWKANQHT